MEMKEQMQRNQRREEFRRRQARRTFKTALYCSAIAFLLGCLCGMKLSANLQVAGNSKAATGISAGTSDGDLAAELAAVLNDVPDVTVDAPVNYSYDEAISVLSSMEESDSTYRQIVDQADDYPEKLLISLANNPEMLSFVADYDGLSEENATDSLTAAELAVSCPLFLQWDKRWGACSYGDESNIAVSGCGPTALSMAIVALTGNAAATPDEVAEYAMNNGYYLYGTGTKWSLMTEGATSYGLDSKQMNAVDDGTIKACLDAGGLVICSMREGDFTTGGHFILLYGYDEEGFSLNDPFCIYRSRQKWTYESLDGQIKAAWAAYA